ncbi:calcium-regulated actin-bundling protein [Acrasis kona]|uniref:Calcium-regulated actin-bundling protein n=1 Tax=Acrasis kona TaxID=1008807 RepID=A0AAW2Z6D2_9EUKA
MPEGSVTQSPFDKEAFNAVCNKNYKGQCIFFLNAFWAEFQAEAPRVWNVYKKFVELDNGNEEGKSLDTFSSNRLLEAFGQTLTVIQLREEMAKVDQNDDKKMGPLEYLVYHYKVQIKELLSRPQGTDEEMEKANLALQKVQDEIDAIENQKKKLQALAKGEDFKATRAKNELAQLLAQDPLALNKAQVDAKAAVKKAQKSAGDNLTSQGQLWWLQKQLEEAARYKPKGNLSSPAAFSPMISPRGFGSASPTTPK